jgi:hypothetical protein
LSVKRDFAFIIVLFTAALVPPTAFAQPDACVALCRVPCVKPTSIPDRWDDLTGIPGYMGEAVRRPDWRGNHVWNQEPFSDANGNGLWDAGESYIDDNGNTIHDAEAYHPLLTGYLGSNDQGLEIVLRPGSTSGAPAAGMYYCVALPPSNKGTPDLTTDAYRYAWASCQPTAIEPSDRLQLNPSGLVGPTNQAMVNLIAADADAIWDPGTMSIQNSSFDLSPRVFLLAAHDPRVPIASGRNDVVVVKVLAFFAERMVGPAQVQGRLLRIQAPGETCGGGSAGGFVVECPVPAAPASWGRVKAVYR